MQPRTTGDLRDASHLMPADITDQIDELRRIQNRRASEYPLAVRAGRLTEKLAIMQNHRLAAAIASLESARDAEQVQCSCPYCPNSGEDQAAGGRRSRAKL